MNLLNALQTLIKFELFFKYRPTYKTTHIWLFRPVTCDVAREGGMERGWETEIRFYRTENRFEEKPVLTNLILTISSLFLLTLLSHTHIIYTR